MLDAIQVQDCKNKQIEQSRAFAQSYYSWFLYGHLKQFTGKSGLSSNQPLSTVLRALSVKTGRPAYVLFLEILWIQNEFADLEEIY